MSGWPLRVLVYGAGDAVGGVASLTDPIKAQLTRLGGVATNGVVAAVAELDAASPPSLRWVLDPAGRQPVVPLPEVDTGDPAQLVDFVRWASDTCPGEATLLALSGHGAAWNDSLAAQAVGSTTFEAARAGPVALRHPRRLVGRAVSTQGSLTRALLIDGDDRDYLSNAELAAVCERIASGVLGDKLDVLVLDACLMSAWEILAELGGAVRAVVAAIDEISASGIDLSVPVAALSEPGAARDHRAVAATVADRFVPATTFDSVVAVDLADPAWAEAIGHFRGFCTAVGPWVAQARENADALRHALLVASTSVVGYTGGGLADLGALAAAVAGEPGVPPGAVAEVTKAAAGAGACVLARSAGRDYRNAMGISVFSPPSATLYGVNRPDYVRLRFAVDTGWAGVLDLVHGYDAGRGRFL